MGDFFTAPPNPEIPPPPGSDSFDVPPPDFRTIGQQFGAGMKDAGAFGGLLKDVGNTVLKIVTAVVGAVLSLLLCIVAFAIGLINRMYEGADPGVAAIATRALEHVFGIGAGGSGPRGVGGRTETENASRAIGKKITDAIGAGAKASGGTTLQPGTKAAEDFLGMLARIGIEGWMEGQIIEELSLGYFKGILELTPIMSQILGLGRLSRRVLGPALKILVADPYTWYLNDKFRPALLAHDQATRQFLRGRMTRENLDRELGRQGFSPSSIEALININSKLLSLGDIDYLVARGHWSQAQGVQSLKDDGYAEGTANQLLALAVQRRLDVHNQQLLDTQIAAYERGEIDQDTLHTGILASTIPDGEKAVLEITAVLRRQLNVKHLTLGEVQTMVKAHIMSIDDVRTWMTRENYPPEEQTFLELLILGEIINADQATAAKRQKAIDAAAAKAALLKKQQDAAAAAAAKLQAKGVSLAAFEKLVELGLRTFDEFRTFLTQQGFSSAAIADLVDLLHATIQAKQDAATAHAALIAAADVKHVPLATIEKAVLAGTLGMADLEKFLVDNEYAPADVKIVLDYVQAQLDAKAANAKTKAGAAATAKDKQISLPELERASRLGLTTVDAYAAALDRAGFDATSRDLMVGLLRDQISGDQGALANRATATAAAKKKKISLPDLERAVIAGVRPMTDYQAELSALGFDSADQASLVALLQLQADHAKDVAATKAAAAAKLGAKQLSLSQIERAVKLGVLSIDQYTAELAGAGFSSEDQTILTTSLLAELAQLKQTQARRNAISKSLAKKGISLAQEEQLVKDGIRTLDAYQAFLLAQGYSATDAAALGELLKEKTDQAQAAAAAHQVAQQRALTKEIPLAKEEQAVIDGIRTMDDYAALLADLGFDDVDQATLEELLSQKVAAARAKAAAKAPPAPSGPLVP